MRQLWRPLVVVAPLDLLFFGDAVEFIVSESKKTNLVQYVTKWFICTIVTGLKNTLLK